MGITYLNAALIQACIELLILILFLCYVLKEIYYLIHQGRIGYVPSQLGRLGPKLDEIIDAYGLQTDEMTLVEIGAGLGHVSCYLAKRYKWKSVIAVELDLVMILMAKIYKLFHRQPIQFVFSDVFKYKTPKGAIVYCYMSTQIIQDMKDKGLFNDNLLCSLTFPLRDIEPIEEYEVGGLQERLYVYQVG